MTFIYSLMKDNGNQLAPLIAGYCNPLSYHFHFTGIYYPDSAGYMIEPAPYSG